MVVVIVMLTVVMIVVMIAMVFAVPVALMYSPALLVVVVVRMAPVGARVGWPLPSAGDPDVAATACSPVTVNPVVAFFRHRRPYLVADRWRRAEIDLDLTECRGGQGRCGDEST